ncbi:MAG TPA: hypothetical protein VN457_01060, partial [Chlamydiales bacterium]|nr:hypothetical protein [Chlamydiales bacterium]
MVQFDEASLMQFQKEPQNYVLAQKGDRIVAEKKGICTWLKANLFCRGDYKLHHIVEGIRQTEGVEETKVKAINLAITKYNRSHIGDRKRIKLLPSHTGDR